MLTMPQKMEEVHFFMRLSSGSIKLPEILLAEVPTQTDQILEILLLKNQPCKYPTVTMTLLAPQ